MDEAVQQWIDQFGMQPHPEGGFFAETYRSEEQIPGSALPARYQGARDLGTSIYFLLPAGTCSKLHRLQTDEIWHFYAGGSLSLHLFLPNGEKETLGIGPEGPFQVTVPHGCWFGARPELGAYSLVGCTMAPAFDFADFEMGDRAELISAYPRFEELITELT